MKKALQIITDAALAATVVTADAQAYLMLNNGNL